MGTPSLNFLMFSLIFMNIIIRLFAYFIIMLVGYILHVAFISYQVSYSRTMSN